MKTLFLVPLLRTIIRKMKVSLHKINVLKKKNKKIPHKFWR